ncbi:hypothetical protein [Alistipes sp.]|uniref:hypothetical protein n=1 Tax=Alistipes sp. TaxID=1872444 RepID=UPI003AEF8A75
MIQTSPKRKLTQRLEIECDCVTDTLKAVFVAGIRFDKKFGEDIQINEAKEVYPMTLSYTNDSGVKIHLSAYNPIDSEFDKCIWEACARQFQIWLKKQPYSDMVGIDRFYGHNAFSHGYPVYLVPKSK